MTPLTKLIDEQVREFHGGHHEKSNFERAKIENKRSAYMVPVKIFVLPQFNTNLPVHCFPKYFLWTACRNLYRTETQFLVKQ